MAKRLNTKVGQKYWHITVLEKFKKGTGRKNIWYKCLCDCGKECEVHSDNLRRTNGQKSCGCNHHWGNRATDLTGQRFNSLVAVRPTEKRTKGNSIIWLFKCDCGKEKEINCADVIKLSTKSCGCQRRNPDREDSVWKKMFSSLPTKSKRYGGDTDINFEEFKFLSKQNCFYCGKPPSNCAKSFGTDPVFVKYTGLDRIDSSLPYLKTNVRPCCKQCNGAKSDHSEKDYFDFIKRSFENLFKKGIL